MSCGKPSSKFLFHFSPQLFRNILKDEAKRCLQFVRFQSQNLESQILFASHTNSNLPKFSGLPNFRAFEAFLPKPRIWEEISEKFWSEANIQKSSMHVWHAWAYFITLGLHVPILSLSHYPPPVPTPQKRFIVSFLWVL